MREFSLDQFEERSAILEYCGGMDRFTAETAAAREQGLERWQALHFAMTAIKRAEQEARNANRRGPAGAAGHHADALGGQRDADPLPRVQRQSQEEARPVPERQPEARRDRGDVLALRKIHGCSL